MDSPIQKRNTEGLKLLFEHFKHVSILSGVIGGLVLTASQNFKIESTLWLGGTLLLLSTSFVSALLGMQAVMERLGSRDVKRLGSTGGPDNLQFLSTGCLYTGVIFTIGIVFPLLSEILTLVAVVVFIVSFEKNKNLLKKR